MSIYLAHNSRILMINGITLIPEPDQPEPEPPAPTFDEVTIGTQTWMSKNLSIDDGGDGIYTQTVNYGQGDVVEYYYTWEAAVRVAASIDGWHLPSDSEYRTLANQVGGISIAGTKLKSTYGWSSGNGTNDYGFTVVPAGIWYKNAFRFLGTKSELWTSHILSQRPFYFSFNTSESIDWFSHKKNDYALSVRLIKDS